MSKDRIQINIRVELEDLAMVEALRKLESPIPTASEIWRRGLREMYARKKKPKR